MPGCHTFSEQACVIGRFFFLVFDFFVSLNIFADSWLRLRNFWTLSAPSASRARRGSPKRAPVAWATPDKSRGPTPLVSLFFMEAVGRSQAPESPPASRAPERAPPGVRWAPPASRWTASQQFPPWKPATSERASLSVFHNCFRRPVCGGRAARERAEQGGAAASWPRAVGGWEAETRRLGEAFGRPEPGGAGRILKPANNLFIQNVIETTDLNVILTILATFFKS